MTLRTPNIDFSDHELMAIIDNFDKEDTSLFQYYKLSTLKRRIIRRMRIHNISSLQDYFNLFKNDNEERQSLKDDFLINVTDFFRNKEAYDIFYNYVLPKLIANCDLRDGLKIWVCACSTGEEAYSIAIMINEYLEANNLNIPCRIFATDINIKNIEKARLNQYTPKELSCVPLSYLEKYFTKNGKTYSLNSLVKNQIYFSVHNILKNPPAINCDFISCRNLLIYLKLEQQYKVLQKLHHSLKTNGILWLGANESSLQLNNNFEEINGKWKFYQKKEISIALPISIIYDFDEQYIIPQSKNQDLYPMPKNTESFQSLLDQFGFATLIINKDFDIISSNGQYSLYLQMPEHQLKLNLLSMLSTTAKFDIRQAVLECIEHKKSKALHNLDINENHKCSAWIIPEYNGSNELITVIFGNYLLKEDLEKNTDIKTVDADYASKLERELSQLQHKYDSLIKEFDNNTYSLQIVNEDLMSTNEEMQSANEELQALNEELNSLNVEFQQKIRDLQNLNEDFDNYFKNSNNAQIILDSQLNIKRFNPKAQEYFNILNQDIGRPLSDLSNQFVDYDLSKELHLVLSKNDYRTAELMIKDDRNAKIFIAPYIKSNQQIDGVVISIVDTTEIYHVNSTFQAVFHNNFNAIVIIKPEYNAENDSTQFKILSINKLAESIIGIPQAEIVDKSLFTIMSNILGENGINAVMKAYSKNEKIVEDISIKKGFVTVYYEFAVKPINNGLILIFRDTSKLMESINEQKKNYLELLASREQANQLNINLEETINLRTKDLIESNERFNQLTIATNDIIKDWDLAQQNFWINDNFYEILNYPKTFEIITEEDWIKLVCDEDRDRYRKYVKEFLSKKKSEFEIEYSLLNIEGQQIYVHEKGFLYYDEHGIARRFISSIRELTVVKEAQRVLEQQLKDKNEFLSVASHELKTPVTSIKGAVQLLDMYYNKDGDEMAQKLIETAVKQSNKLSDFVEDLLDVTRINEGKLSINTHKTSLIYVVKNAVNQFEIQNVKQFNVKIQENIKDEMMGDDKRLEQVFVNIISNAVKFSKNANEIDIELSNNSEDTITVSIRDYGIGMNELQIQKIFDRYYGKNEIAQEVTGLGLGMYISKEIIDKHNGVINIKSKLKEGTKFSITFPLCN